MGVFDGKVAVVTGAASGIGLASSRRLHGEGAALVMVDIDEEALGPAAEELDAIAVVGDVSRTELWDDVVEAARSLGGVDAAHLNAGVTTGRPDITDLRDDEYRRIMAVNVDGVVFGTRALVPELERRGGGAIVATSSMAGLIAFPGDAAYTATKHAVVGFVRAVAPSLRDKHITINTVCPGLVDTPLIDGAIRDALASSGFPLISPEDVAEAVYSCLTGPDSGKAVVVQLGVEPTPFRFGRVPGPRAEGVEGKIPPEWLADRGEPAAT
jgi:NAD(P)-dependent dehydrogenase (short-subunit alcohol dehydrogenase family)